MKSALTIYGIKNCSTMKKAFDWLDQAGIAYTFHDYKKAGVGQQELSRWADGLGWQALLNTQGTTWRRLTDEERADVDRAKALALMQRYPSLIKRPVIEGTGALLAGFNPERYQQTLQTAR